VADIGGFSMRLVSDMCGSDADEYCGGEGYDPVEDEKLAMEFSVIEYCTRNRVFQHSTHVWLSAELAVIDVASDVLLFRPLLEPARDRGLLTS
jgi:hypothetical protein